MTEIIGRLFEFTPYGVRFFVAWNVNGAALYNEKSHNKPDVEVVGAEKEELAGPCGKEDSPESEGSEIQDVFSYIHGARYKEGRNVTHGLRAQQEEMNTNIYPKREVNERKQQF
ncbi:hypothetical protein T265_02828 [Opisthorchis viverrini]|uniref:Uncharacterized protein n=1 Tax=Opisthorchis viverrini TaxID=6198 RepID=A0A074ZXU6_OPIVI|nr:hypothetical protein T265_02828 [Opisthorchis viverrini]KER30787.1 hypothetical protein T265_02828 [Opisthorchis viverrini]